MMKSAGFHEICQIPCMKSARFHDICTEYMKSGGFHEIRQMTKGPMVLFLHQVPRPELKMFFI